MYEPLFVTHLFKFVVIEPEMNNEIAQLLQRMKDSDSSEKGNQSGWRSDWLHNKEESCLKKLTALTNTYFNKVVTTDNEYQCK